jgi:uncharacterized membrane protein YhdT
VLGKKIAFENFCDYVVVDIYPQGRELIVLIDKFITSRLNVTWIIINYTAKSWGGENQVPEQFVFFCIFLSFFCPFFVILFWEKKLLRVKSFNIDSDGNTEGGNAWLIIKLNETSVVLLRKKVILGLISNGGIMLKISEQFVCNFGKFFGEDL